MQCRIGCGACCIAPSLSSAIPGMPQGKPAGIRCVQLTADNVCKIYGMADRPDVCVSYQATREFCGSRRSDAMRLLCELEQSTGRSNDR
ncbi:MAG TPA: YkgJ family cysteine cluster protein [Nitrospirota bacterium]|nr:YkgJ family cysteine cluster protein [Nitrospirota bacterium]